MTIKITILYVYVYRLYRLWVPISNKYSAFAEIHLRNSFFWVSRRTFRFATKFRRNYFEIDRLIFPLDDFPRRLTRYSFFNMHTNKKKPFNLRFLKKKAFKYSHKCLFYCFAKQDQCVLLKKWLWLCLSRCAVTTNSMKNCNLVKSYFVQVSLDNIRSFFFFLEYRCNILSLNFKNKNQHFSVM